MTVIIIKLVAVVVIGYLLGSIPVGYLLGRRQAKVDVRTYGSGKTGAANVFRTAGRKWGLLVAVLDICKGALAVVIAGFIVRGDYLLVGDSGLWWLFTSAQVLAALAAVTGHIWSVFLGFKGGRGVATFFGGLVALCPVAALFGGEVLIIGAGLTRFVSLGSIAGAVGSYAILVPLTILNGFPIEYLFYALVGVVIIFVMHRDNIRRLISGKERRLGDKADEVRLPPSGATKGAK
ncbi:MAG: glycerol-3-phosphate 1-O-acyltransferase PlsY [Dehalococcoidales bacterium]|jgi:glycerol-3-phosphate acyltransferase PlsY|nr:glycerol-3-phosphate 1-O-acyltransferase PlsY [Dehalococcoidales bacterium]